MSEELIRKAAADVRRTMGTNAGLLPARGVINGMVKAGWRPDGEALQARVDALEKTLTELTGETPSGDIETRNRDDVMNTAPVMPRNLIPEFQRLYETGALLMSPEVLSERVSGLLHLCPYCPEDADDDEFIEEDQVWQLLLEVLGGDA